MRKPYILILAASFLYFNSFANILRVGYPGLPLSGTDYPDLQAGHDAAAAGDTIYLFPGNWGCNMSKKLVIIGKGYFTEGEGANTNLQKIAGTVSVIIELFNGSDNSIFYGIGDGYIRAFLGNETANIKIRRCNLSNVWFSDKTCNNWEISQCFIKDNLSFAWNGGLVTNLHVSNCYLNVTGFSNGATSGQSGLFENNVFGGNLNNNFHNGGFVFQSNIFIGTSTSFTESENCFFQNNLAEPPTLLPNTDGNINSVDMSTTFLGWPDQSTFSTDGRFQLKAGSPAISAGYKGANAGMFGGANPYKLSGIPPIPAFYKLAAPSTVASSNPYTITVSVRSNN